MNTPTGPNIPQRRTGSESQGGIAGAVERFKELPRPAQIAVGIVFLGILYLMLGGHKTEVSQTTAKPNMVTQADLNKPAAEGQQNGVFQGIEADRPVLLQNWLEQNRRDMADLKTNIEQRFKEKDQALSDAMQQNMQMQQQMQQMMTDFTSEIKNIQGEGDRNREMMNQLADEQKKLQLNQPVDGTSGPSPVQGKPREKINQTPLGGGAGGGAAPTAPGSNVHSLGVGGSTGDTARLEEGKLPFVPPLGFIKGTLLNGVDALVGGKATPAIVRLHGTYKTAMNGTVNLDGCFVMVEFQGEISTERAVGKPGRMTCIYPDNGAMSYDTSGYVVDAEDGIIGVPGVFYEGDASRVAAAMLADFAAGMSAAVQQNQFTTQTSTGSNGSTSTQTPVGNSAKSELAGGVTNMTKSLRDYLMERVNRVVPFIRLDATREIHLVLLSGTELRAEGSPWSVLFNAEGADRDRASNASNPNIPLAPSPLMQPQPSAGNNTGATN